MFVPREFSWKFEDSGLGSPLSTDEFVGRDHKTDPELARKIRPRAARVLAGRAFGILQRETQFLGEIVDRRALPLPRSVGLETQRADAAAPRRDDAADGAVVGAI